MAMFGSMGGLTRLADGSLAGPGSPLLGGDPGSGGQLHTLENGMLAGPSWPGLPGSTTPTAPHPPAQGGGITMPTPPPAPAGLAMPAGHSPSTWQTVAGLIGDGLLTATGHNAMFAPIAAQGRQNQLLMQRQAQQQAVEFQRQMAEKAWERANPAPPAVANNYDWIESHFPGKGAGYVDAFSQNGGAQGPATMVVNGQTMMRAPGAASGPAQPTPEGIARLKANPSEAHQFDEMFGQGASAKYLGTGGAAPATGPGGFPSIQQATDAVAHVESNGIPGAVGPATPWGRAKGNMQLLDGTAKGMAAKLGVEWRPDLMTAKTPEAAQYQRALGDAYYHEGLEKTGNHYDAARYYFAGPDRRLWGPKTTAYADAVTARLRSM